MSSQRCRLGKLVHQGRQLYSQGLVKESMRQFCMSQPDKVGVVSTMALGPAKAIAAASNSHQIKAKKARRVFGKVPSKTANKIIGVKKTIINQLQGMTREMVTKPPGCIGSTGKTYKIYGQTGLFSSSSSLSSRKSSVSSVSSVRRLSSSAKRDAPYASAAPAAMARQYQFMNAGDDRLSRLAQEISQSIQEELMHIDPVTKSLISCMNIKSSPSSYGERPMPSTAMRHLTDPLEGWNHPHRVKNLLGKSLCGIDDTDDVVTQIKPRRRKATNVKYNVNMVKDNVALVGSVGAINTLGFGGTIAHKLHPHLKDLHLRNRERVNGFRYDNRLPSLSHPPPKRSQRIGLANAIESDMDAESLTMDLKAPLKGHSVMLGPRRNAQKAGPAESNERYMQQQEERDFLANTILSSGDLNAGRLDDLHYEATVAPNMMSASQRVINKHFESYRNYMGKAKDKVKQLKMSLQIVDSINPTPDPLPMRGAAYVSRNTTPAPVAKKPRVKITGRLPTPMFVEPMLEDDEVAVDEKPELPERQERPERIERSERWERSDRKEPPELRERRERSDRPMAASDRAERAERIIPPERTRPSDRAERADEERPQRYERTLATERSGKFEKPSKRIAPKSANIMPASAIAQKYRKSAAIALKQAKSTESMERIKGNLPSAEELARSSSAIKMATAPLRMMPQVPRTLYGPPQKMHVQGHHSAPPAMDEQSEGPHYGRQSAVQRIVAPMESRSSHAAYLDRIRHRF